MNYTTEVSVPTAHITKNKSRLKVYDNKNIYLENGDTFEFELYNPKTTTVLVKIKINGNYISSSGLLVKPGQRVFLERFIDTNNKFVFNTYDVENNPQNKDAIAFNGDISVEFYDETNFIPNFSYYPHLSNGSWSTGWGGISSGYNSVYFTNTTSSINGSSLTKTTTSNIETGRIEKGEGTSQEFQLSSQKFQQFYFHKVVYKILPRSTKSTTIREIINYCPECGRKQKKEYKYCPSCGTKL